MQSQRGELYEREIERLQEGQRELKRSFETEIEQLKEQEENKRLKEQVKSLIHNEVLVKLRENSCD